MHRNAERQVCEVCQEPAAFKCSNCRRAHYCRRQHQREDWRRHRHLCAPFKICEDERLGRHLVATRTLQPGDLILNEAPLVWGPAPNTIPVCLGCGRGVTEENSRPCSKCGWPVCGEMCERAPSHLPECGYTAQRGQRVAVKNFGIQHPIYRCVTVLRCLYRKQFLPKAWKRLETLQTHQDTRRQLAVYESERVTVAEFIRRFFKLSSFCEEDIMAVYGMLMVNGHEVPLTEPAHIAVYGTASILEHSCTANCSKSFTADGHLIVVAAGEIAEGEHLSICYTDALWGTPNRRYFLNETKYFWCQCKRCEDPTEFNTDFSALKCQNMNCSGHLLPATFTEERRLQDWTCNKCAKVTSSYSVHDVLDRIGRDLYDLDKDDIAACKNFLANYENYLSEDHFYRTDVKYTLSYTLGRGGVATLTDEDLALKLRCCRDLDRLLKVVAPAEKRVLGTVLFEMHASLAELARRGGSTDSSSELLESRKVLVEAIFMLKDEPEVLPEGKMCEQARRNLQDLDAILRKSGQLLV